MAMFCSTFVSMRTAVSTGCTLGFLSTIVASAASTPAKAVVTAGATAPASIAALATRSPLCSSRPLCAARLLAASAGVIVAH